MRIEVDNRCSDFNSYRAARVKSLFNVESGANFALSADLPVDDKEWSIGLIVGPSGSGKTSIGRKFWGGDAFADFANWPNDKPIVDAI
jgi:phage terminase large subunit-like protein